MTVHRARHRADALECRAILFVARAMEVMRTIRAGDLARGSARRALGIAALTLGQLDLAIEHLAAAVAANEEIGHRPAAIQAKAELALAHLRRAGEEVGPRGRTLLQQAIAAGEAAAMDGLVTRWRQAVPGEESGPRVTRHAVRMSQPQAGR